MADDESSPVSSALLDIVYSPLNLILLSICAFLLYRIIKIRTEVPPTYQRPPEMPKMKRRDFSLEQLKPFNGTDNERILMAVNGKVFDVTRGKKFYGPGGPYAAFAGKDASRGLATFQVESFTDEYDDLSDLNTMQMESVKEWELQFMDKYVYVGRLLKPGEEPNDYSDEEDNSENKSEDKKAQ